MKKNESNRQSGYKAGYKKGFVEGKNLALKMPRDLYAEILTDLQKKRMAVSLAIDTVLQFKIDADKE